MSQFNRLPLGSLVLVTGGTGLIGSAVTTLLLDRGYKVRIATRSVAKQGPFKELLEKKHGADAVEFVEIADYDKEESWDKILKGVSGVVHLASDTSFDPDPNAVAHSRKMTRVFLEATNKHESIKSVILTSSRITAYQPEHGKDIHATKNDWTDWFIDAAANAKEGDPVKGILTYAATKVAEERAAWEYVDKVKPHYAFTTVLPDYVAGPVDNPSPGGYSTHGWLNELFHGNTDGLAGQVMNPAARFVDVRDVAAVHVAALLDETTESRRLFAAAHKFTLNEILAVWRKEFPEREIVADVDWPKQPEVDLEQGESTELLKAFAGRDWYSFEETVIANVQDVL